jgi:isoleucyl-tRNA synthetase
VEVVASDAELVRLRARPNFRALGKRYGKQTPQAAAAAAALTPEELRRVEAGETVTRNGEGFVFGPEDVAVEREVVSDWLVQSHGGYVAALDPRLSDELTREGLARELVNRIQRLRKEAGYEYTTRIALWIQGPPPVLEAARTHAGFLRGETLARALELDSVPPAWDRQETVDLDGHQVTIAVARHPASPPDTV